jgi:CDP-paratose 2-epimerase
LEAAGVVFHRGDVRESTSFPAGAFDFLIECSAEPSVLAGLDGSPDYLIETNLMGAYQCLEKARQWNAAFLFISTSRVYPIHRLEGHPWREEETRFCWLDAGTSGITSKGVSEIVDMSGARSLYGYTKYSAEQLIDEYRAAFGLRSIVNRCGVIAGPWQFGKVDQGVASLWVLAHHFGRPLAYIGYGGNGKQIRDFLHVEDFCDLVLQQITAFDIWDGWVGNVAGGLANAGSLHELTGLCRQFVGREVPIRTELVNRPADLRIFVADCSRLFDRTTWRPKRDLPCIIQDISNWVREHATLLQNL